MDMFNLYVISNLLRPHITKIYEIDFGCPKICSGQPSANCDNCCPGASHVIENSKFYCSN